MRYLVSTFIFSFLLFQIFPLISISHTLHKFNKNIDGKNDSVGPGTYNIQSNWEKNFLSWEKMRNDNDEKYNIIKARKNLSPLAQLEKDYLLNYQQELNVHKIYRFDNLYINL